jgi:2'-5' RNA ligase
MTYNYFLAAILEEETRKEILKYGLDPADPRLQHTTPFYNLHITLGYIGPVQEDLLPKVAACFKTLEALPVFQLRFSGIDFFGSRSNFKRYIGLTIDDPEEKLKQINQFALKKLEKETKLTFRGSHREFKPHITFQLLKHKLKAQERHEFLSHVKSKHKKPLHFWIKSLGLWYRNPKTQRYETVSTYHLQEPI